MKTIGFVVLLVTVAITASVSQVPDLITHNGYLTDSLGVAISGNRPMTFRLFQDSTTAVADWTQSFPAVMITNGVYRVNLDVSGVDFRRSYWLETQVGSSVLSPRTRMTNVPYALEAVNAGSLHLPYSGAHSTSSSSSIFQIESAGGDGSAAVFFNSNTINNTPALIALTYGTAEAGRFTATGTGDGLTASTALGTNGISGGSSAFNGTGVRGDASNGSLAYGVYGTSSSGAGVVGSGSSVASGMIASTSGSGDALDAVATGLDAYAIYASSANWSAIYAQSSYGLGAAMQAVNNRKNGYALYASNDSGLAIVCSGDFEQEAGSFTAFPTSTTWPSNKPATVKLSDGTRTKLFAEEAAEVYFNDYGEGNLVNGRAHVALDPKFLQTVTIGPSHPMKVFVQMEGDCNGVFVANKSPNGFDVVELQNGSSNASFSFRVVCKRKYYEGERLATEAEDTRFNTKMLETVWPEVMQKRQAERTRINQNQLHHMARMDAAMNHEKSMPLTGTGRTPVKSK